MFFTAILAPALLLLLLLPFSSAAPQANPPPSVGQTTLGYDPKYDDPDMDLSQTACSDGDYGLLTAGYSTIGSIPQFPRVGGSFTVQAWNSPKCGACYQVMYLTKAIYVTAVDHAAEGFNVAKAAMDELTAGRAIEVGRIQVAYHEVEPYRCGFI